MTLGVRAQVRRGSWPGKIDAQPTIPFMEVLMSDYIMPDQFVKKTKELLRQVPVNFREDACDKIISLFGSIDYTCMTGKDIDCAKDQLNSGIEKVDDEVEKLNNMFPNKKEFDEHRKQIQEIRSNIDDLSDEVTDLDV